MLFKLLPKSSFIKYSCVYIKSVNAPKPRGKLTIIPTPIGNLKDLSPNVLKALYSADLIGCEDRRVAGQLYHLIRSKNIIKQTEQYFGSLGLTSLVQVGPQQQVQQQAHQFYNFANMNEKQRRKFLRKMSQEQQQAFRVQYLKYRALKILNKESQWGYSGTADKLDQLYGIDISDLKHIQTQILNCRKRKGRGLLIPLNTYNQTKMFDMVKALLQTKNVALVSDAGMPCISDPGWKLVDKLRQTMSDVPIQVVGGPSSVAILALQASLCSKGNTLSGRFQGFASLATGNYEQKNLELHNIKMKQFSINFINANKLKARLLDLQKKFGGEHQILLNNELTKKYERRFQGSISQMINKLDDPKFRPVGEVSYLLYPSKEEAQDVSQEPAEEQVKSVEEQIDAEELEQKLYNSISIDIREFLQSLEQNSIKMSSRDKTDFICSVFGIKKGEARKYVYDQFSKNQN